MTWVTFLSLLALACGDLIFDIDIDTTHETAVIDVRGNIKANIISDTERKTFGIEDEQLKNAVETYTKDGSKPDNVYVKAGGKEDLYSKYNWFEVKRYVTPKYLDLKPKVNCKYVAVPTSLDITTNWIKGGNLTVTDNIKYNIYFDGKEAFTENDEWGKKINSYIFNIKKPEKDQECVMEVKIEYEATIAGDVAADYTKKRTANEGTHYFWAYDLRNVQNAANLKKSIVTTQTISVTY